MQTPHRSEFFGLCFSLSSMDRRTQNTECFVLPPRVNVAFPLSQTGVAGASRRLIRQPSRDVSRFSFRLACRFALAKYHTHEECKECHEVNVMASQWNCGGGSVLWAEPGLQTLPSSLSVWAAMMNTYPVLSLSGKSFFFPLLRRAGGEGERIEGWGNRRWDALKEKDGGRGRSVCCLLTGWGGCVRGLPSGSQDPWPFSALWPWEKHTPVNEIPERKDCFMCFCEAAN